MSLCLVKVTPDLARRIEDDPDLLEQLWDGDDDAPDAEIAAIDRERDTLFEDFVDVSREVEAEAERFPWMKKALEGVGAEIDFDFGYGNGFVVTAAEAAEIADGLASEGWWQPGQEVTLIPEAIAAFYRAAADEERTVIGGVA